MGEITRRFKKNTLVCIKEEMEGVFKVIDYDSEEKTYELQVVTPYIFSVTKEKSYIGQLVHAEAKDVISILYRVLKKL